MRTFFNIRYEMDPSKVHSSIDSRLKEIGADYICVADGVIMNMVNRFEEYCRVVNGGMFAICDSSYVPLYIKLIYGTHYEQYSGSDIFWDIISSRKYRMSFLGSHRCILDGLKFNLKKINPDIENMQFIELPFCDVEEFDYPSIAKIIEDDKSDIIWVSLGAPKQEYFMSLLKPHLRHGIMIAVGAVFKFYSGVDVNRAPQWMIKHHMEFIYRLIHEPRKQMHRCGSIIYNLPIHILKEWKISRKCKVDLNGRRLFN